MTTLANLAPFCAIFGFILIFIKIFVQRKVKIILCVHVMVLSVIAAALYFLRGSVMEGSDLISPYFIGVLWILIGFMNYIEFGNHRRLMNK